MRRKGPYIGMILLQSVLYGVMDPVAKLVYRTMPVYTFLMARYLLATGFMLAIWGGKIVGEIKTVPLPRYIAPCLCMAAAFIFCNMSLGATAATNMAFLRSLSALIAPILLWIFYRKRYGLKSALLQILMLAGLYLLCARGGLNAFGPGEIYALIGAVLLAGALVFGQDALRYVSAVTLSCVQSGCAICLCLICGIADGSFAATDWEFAATAANAASLAYAALGCTVGGYMLQNTALKHISSRLVGVLQCTYPILTALVAFVLLGERLSPGGAVGAAIILLCVAGESLLKE